MGAWRYHTLADCRRVWVWFSKVGPAEIVRGVVPACVRSAALALPLLAGPAAGPLLAAPAAVPALPWIGAPGWVQTALPFGLGGYGYGQGFGGAYGYAGGAGTGLLVDRNPIVPGVPPVGGEVAGGRTHIATNVLPQTALIGHVPDDTAGVGSTPLASDTPTDVPCPPGLAVVAVALAGLAVGRRRG